MGGPMGFAVTTTTTTTTSRRDNDGHHDDVTALTSRMNAASLLPLRYNTAMRVPLTTIVEQQEDDLRKKRVKYIDMLVAVLTTPHPSSGRVEPGRSLGEYIKKEFGDTERCDVTSDAHMYNRGILTYTHSLPLYACKVAEMLNLLSTVTDVELQTDRRIDENVFATLSHRNGRFVDALLLVDVAFFHRFKYHANRLIANFRRQMMVDFLEGLVQLESGRGLLFHEPRTKLDLYLLSPYSDLYFFLTMWREFIRHPNEELASGLQIEMCLASLRVLCVVPLFSSTPGNESCIGNIHVRDMNRNSTSLLVSLLTGYLGSSERPVPADSYFRPTWQTLCDYLTTDAGILESVPTADVPDISRDAMHTLFFVLALVHAACQPYERNDDDAAKNMSAWFLPLLEAAFHALILAKQPPAGADAAGVHPQSLGIDFSKTLFMRQRVVRTLEMARDEYGETLDEIVMIGLGDLLWEAEEEDKVVAATKRTRRDDDE